MADAHIDKISTISRGSIASITSRLSTLWSKVPLSSRKLSSTIADICSYIGSTPDAQLSPIKELRIRKEEGGVQHEFLLLRLEKPSGEEFWVRLERKGPTGTLRRLMSSRWEANDVATVSGKVAALLGSAKSVEKTKITFRVSPSLTDLFCVLEALRTESRSYQVWPENCYFFASVVAEHLHSLDNGAELTGALRWLDLGTQARRRIHQIITSYETVSVYDPDTASGSMSPLQSPSDREVSEAYHLNAPFHRSNPELQDAHSVGPEVDLHTQNIHRPRQRASSSAESLLDSRNRNGQAGPIYPRRPTEGRQNNAALIGGSRKAFRKRVHRGLAARVPILVTEVESMAAMTYDELLIKAISRLTQILKAQYKLLYSSPDEANHQSGLQSSIVRVLSKCKRVLYEHLHGLSDVPGARKLQHHFPRVLSDKLDLWVSSAGDKVSEWTLDQNQVHKLYAEVMNVLGAFDEETAHIEVETGTAPLKLYWEGQECSSSADLDLALWTLQHLSYCESLRTLFGEHRHKLKEDIPELRALFDSAIPAKAKFACKSWISLVCRVGPMDPEVAGTLEQVFSKWIRYWVVAMAVMDKMDVACSGLHRLEQWMRGHGEMAKLRLHVLSMHSFVLHSKRALGQCPFLVLSTSPSTEPDSSVLSLASPYNVLAVVIAASKNTQESWSHVPLKLQDHPRPVCSLAFSSDGTRLASAFREKCIWLWNANTGDKVSKVGLPSDCVHVTFYPGGSQVTCGCMDGSIYIYNVDGSGRPKHLSGHSRRVNSVAFTPCGTRFASASNDKTVRIWDADDGSHIRTLQGHTNIVASVAYSPDGKRLASASSDVRVWDAVSGEEIGRIAAGSFVFCVVFHPDNERVVLALGDGTVRVANIFDLDDHVSLENHSHAVYSVSCSADGKWIASASADSNITLWYADGTLWTYARTLVGHTSKVYTVMFSQQDTRVASGSRDRSIRIWDAETMVEQQSKRVSIVIASNARFTLSVCEDNIMRLTDSSDLNASPILLRGHADLITCACFSPGGTNLISASRDLSIRMWDIASGQCTKRVGLTEAIKSVQSSQWSLLAPYHISYSKDGLALRVRGQRVSDDCEEPFIIDLSTGTWTELSTLRPDGVFPQTYQPDPAFPIVLDRNCLCTPLERGLTYLCWLPDDFEPISEVMQTGRRVSVGGRGGEVVYADFDGVSTPEV